MKRKTRGQKLQPCPFCGGEAEEKEAHQIRGLVRCSGCCAMILRDKQRDAVAAWNLRAAPTFVTQDLLDRCETFIEKFKLAKLLKEVCIVRQDFDGAAFYRREQMRFARLNLKQSEPSDRKGAQS